MNHSVEKLKGVPIPVVPLFCQIDNFCQDFESILNHHLLSDGKQKGAEKKKYTGSESSHDLHCPVSSFWLSSLQALLQPVRLPVFALGIPLISQLQSVCAVDGWRFGYHYAPICRDKRGVVLGFRLSTPCRLPSVTIEEFPTIASWPRQLNRGRTPLGGSMVSNFIWWPSSDDQWWKPIAGDSADS